MKIFLLKDIEKIGMAGEIVKVKTGFAKNFILPRNMGLEITKNNESHFNKQVKKIENRKEVINTKTSMLAKKIEETILTLQKKMHDDGKLYGAVSQTEIVQLLAEKGISISKNQVHILKSIKEKGSYSITIKLSSRLQPQLTLKVV